MKRLTITFTDDTVINLSVDHDFSLFDDEGAFQYKVNQGLLGRAEDGREFYVKPEDIRAIAVHPGT